MKNFISDILFTLGQETNRFLIVTTVIVSLIYFQITFSIWLIINNFQDTHFNFSRNYSEILHPLMDNIDLAVTLASSILFSTSFSYWMNGFINTKGGDYLSIPIFTYSILLIILVFSMEPEEYSEYPGILAFIPILIIISNSLILICSRALLIPDIWFSISSNYFLSIRSRDFLRPKKNWSIKKIKLQTTWLLYCSAILSLTIITYIFQDESTDFVGFNTAANRVFVTALLHVVLVPSYFYFKKINNLKVFLYTLIISGIILVMVTIKSIPLITFFMIFLTFFIFISYLICQNIND